MSVNAISLSNVTSHQGSKTYGPIASIQNNEEGKPSWILSGRWITNMINATNVSFNQTNPAVFAASIDMVMLNGSAIHKHGISNFSLSSITNKGKINTINGTVAITMREKPVKDVPVEIKAMDNHVIAILLDVSKTKNHFGGTPIYGTIAPREETTALKSQEGNITTMGITPEKRNMSMLPSN